MKRIYLFAALTTGLVLASCSSDDLAVQQPQPQTEVGDGAVGFDVYTQKATTRAGVTGSLTTAKLLDKAGSDPFNEAGFGVFAFYTDNNEYDQRSVPNFMYNQQVAWNGSTWNYAPLVYWPNEYGDKAKSDDSDKLTFFAYAPYVKVVPSSGKVANTAAAPADNTKQLESYGITGMTRNSNQGDPILKYIASFDADKSVDLCWGVADNNDGINWDITQTGTSQTSPATIENGKPWLDVQRPANTDQKVKFTFKHATAQMQVKIDADVDVDGHGHSNAVAAKTRVWVRQITFKGFALKGSLNLNNDDANKAKWLDYNGQNELVAEDVVVYDQRKDGKEGVNGSVATNEKTVGLNPTLVQDGIYQSVNSSKTVYEDTEMKVVGTDGVSIRKGVTNTPVDLFANGSLFHVIPVDNEAFEVEIVYDIETVDANLAQNLSDGQTKGSSIENRISKKVSFGTDDYLFAGHSYILNLHLGMNSVKFDAAVTDWIAEPTQDVDLPLNVPAFAAGSSPNTVNLPYMGDYTFAITGLNGGESITNEAVSNIVMGDGSANAASTTSATYIQGLKAGIGMTSWSATTNSANTSGVAIQAMTIYPNDNTIDRTQVAKWKGTQSGLETTMTFVQAAHPLYLQIAGFANNGSNGQITLARYNDNEHKAYSHWGSPYGWFCDENGKALDNNSGNNIKVWRNGTLLTWAATATANKYTFANQGQSDKYTNFITIGDKLQPGDVIKVELKTGDAPMETVTATVGGIFYAPATRTVTYRETETVDLTPTHVGEGDLEASLTNSSVPTVSATPASGFAVTTLTAGTTIFTATSTNPLDAVKTATFTLTVNKQGSVIAGFTNSSADFTTLTATVDTPVADFSSVTFKGAEDYGTDAGTLAYSILSVTKNDADPLTTLFDFDSTGKKLIIVASNLDEGVYKVKVKATGTGTPTKYEDAAEEAVITVTVTTPGP